MAKEAIAKNKLPFHWKDSDVYDFWLLSTIADLDKSFLLPYLHQIYCIIQRKGTDEAIIRNGLGVFRKVPIPEDIAGQVYQFCMAIINDGKASIANLSFSISICGKIAQKQTDLRSETLNAAYHLRDTRHSPAIQSATKNVIQRLLHVRVNGIHDSH
jgi:hypothetical protein